MTKKIKQPLIITGNTFVSAEGGPAIQSDGYTHSFQIGIRITGEDMEKLNKINREFFDNEITSSTLARILMRRGMKTFKGDGK
jgi:hypothetical protein